MLPLGAGKSHGEVSKVGLKSGAALARALKGSSKWRALHGEYQRFMGTSESIGEELYKKLNVINAALKHLEEPADDEDVDGQMAQEETIDALVHILGLVTAQHTSLEEGVRPGGLRPFYEVLGKALKSLTQIFAETTNVPIERLKGVRDMAKVLGMEEMHQQMNEEIASKVETSTLDGLSSALSSLASDVQSAARLQEAYTAAAESDLPPELLSGMHSALPILAKLAVTLTMSSDEPQEKVELVLSLLQALAADTRIARAGADDSFAGDTMKENAAMLARVAKAILSFRAAQVSVDSLADSSDHAATGVAWGKLASATHALFGMVHKPPKWVGFVMEEGTPLLDHATKLASSVTAKLGQRGSAEIDYWCNRLAGESLSLEAVAGGSVDSAVWCEKLPDKASNDDILAAFGESLASFDGDAVDDLANSVAKASTQQKQWQQEQKQQLSKAPTQQHSNSAIQQHRNSAAGV